MKTKLCIAALAVVLSNSALAVRMVDTSPAPAPAVAPAPAAQPAPAPAVNPAAPVAAPAATPAPAPVAKVEPKEEAKPEPKAVAKAPAKAEIKAPVAKAEKPVAEKKVAAAPENRLLTIERDSKGNVTAVSGKGMAGALAMLEYNQKTLK